MIHLKNNSEIEKLYRAGQVVKNTLFLMENNISPGVKTLELDALAEEYILSQKCIPGFKGMYDYPYTLCVSINDEVVHGLPSNRILNEGDIVGIDVGSIYDGFYGDHAKTFCVGKVSKDALKLVDITKQSLDIGIKEAKIGNRIGDIGYAIQSFVEKNGYSVVRELVGHGIGQNLHEEPQVPNYGMANTGPLIEPGMCIAIEPMVNIGTYEVFVKDDKWTYCTKDGKLSAHFEHSIAVTNEGTKILTK
ncbi:MAG: type I methionyl aminopeptidase [Candidatus Marinimicrobia bacterium]|nr:type I methionyl aminopeptidase [Candidatus Neomarinimicrobiota bacterium]|tara:strand:+ start:4210 stop:4953 length:744 start_codon:yes stop_codon:yes gene_type:complete